jgi:hypothetical protein
MRTRFLSDAGWGISVKDLTGRMTTRDYVVQFRTGSTPRREITEIRMTLGSALPSIVLAVPSTDARSSPHRTLLRCDIVVSRFGGMVRAESSSISRAATQLRDSRAADPHWVRPTVAEINGFRYL